MMLSQQFYKHLSAALLVGLALRPFFLPRFLAIDLSDSGQKLTCA